MFASSKRSRLLLGSFPCEVVYHLKSYPQGAASLNRTVLESSDKTTPNLTRVLDANPSLFLAREVQPPLIYLRGDGRLNNTQLIKSYTTFYLLSFLLNPSSSSSSFFVRSSSLQGGDPRGPRGGQADLGQPIAAAPRRGPSRACGVLGPKSAGLLSCVSRWKSASRGVSCGAAPSVPRVHINVFV